MNIKRTQFIDFTTKTITYGYRAYNDMSNTYSNMMSEDELKISDDDFLREVNDFYADDTFAEMFDYALERTNFIVIDDVEYSLEMDETGWKIVEKE